MTPSSDTDVVKSAFQNNCDDNGCQRSQHYKKHKHSKQAKQDNFIEDILQPQIVIMSNTDKQFSSDESLVDVDSNQSKHNPLNPWGDINAQDIPMDIKYVPDSNSCPTSHEIEEKMDVQSHIHSNLDLTSDSTSDKNCSPSSSDYSVMCRRGPSCCFQSTFKYRKNKCSTNVLHKTLNKQQGIGL